MRAISTRRRRSPDRCLPCIAGASYRLVTGGSAEGGHSWTLGRGICRRLPCRCGGTPRGAEAPRPSRITKTLRTLRAPLSIPSCTPAVRRSALESVSASARLLSTSTSPSLVPRDPESVRRQCKLHTIVHSQLDPRVLEMGPNGGRGYAEPLSQFSVGETFRRKQPKHLRLARRKLAQHGRAASFRLPSSDRGHHLRPRQHPNMDTSGKTRLPPPREGTGPYDSPRLLC